MFSNRSPTRLPTLYRTTHRTSRRNVLLVVVAVLMVCQLTALGLVADGQVKKAEFRESQLTSQRMAMAQCFGVGARADRHLCMQRAQAENEPGMLYGVPSPAGTALLATSFEGSARAD